MSDLLHEQLSALIDGELRTQETALLLKRLEREPELRARLVRYRACGETLRGARLQPRNDFTLRVCAALEAEPRHAAARGVGFARRYLGPVAGLGVAAAVAAAAIIVLGRPGGLGGTPATVAASQGAPAAATIVVAPPSQLQAAPRLVAERGDFRGIAAEPPSYVTPAAGQGLGVLSRAELAGYVVVHSQVSGPLGLPSAYANLVSDDPVTAAPAPAR